MAKWLVILGHRLERDGSLSHVLNERLETALRLFQQYSYHQVVLLGKGKGHRFSSEAKQMQQWLADHGVSISQMILDDQSRTTWGNIQELVKLLKLSGFKGQIDIITSAFHRSRVHFVLAQLIPKDISFTVWTDEAKIKTTQRVREQIWLLLTTVRSLFYKKVFRYEKTKI